MRNAFLVVAALAAGFLLVPGSRAAAQSDFKVCKSTYALCTTARCTPVPGKKGALSCACDVRTGYSVGLEDCKGVTESGGEQQVSSRYFPVRSYAVCSNDRPWAWCLDKPCTIDPDDPTKAACACTTTDNQGPYVIVTDTYTDETCTSGIISSATVVQIEQVTDFLKSSADLKPFPVKVLNDGN